MSYPDTRPFDLIQASEGISQVSRLLTAQKDRLRGAALIVHQADTLDDAFLAMQTARFTVATAFGARITKEGTYALREYFWFPDTQDLSSLHTPSYRTSIGDADASILSDRPFLTESLKKAFAQLQNPATKAVFINAGKACRSVSSIEKILAAIAPDTRIISLRAPRTDAEEFSPFTQDLSDELIDTTMGSTGSTSASILADLRPAFRLAASSRLSGRLPASAVRGTREFIDLLIDSIPGAPLFLCDAPERFSAEALELLGKRIATDRGNEHYILLSSREPPSSWAGLGVHHLPVPVRPEKDRMLSTTTLIESALGTCNGQIRQGLSKRFKVLAADTMASPGDSGFAKVLELLPREARLYLYELILAEGILEPAELAVFSSRLGLLPGGEALLQDLLRRAGLVDPADTRLPYNPLDSAVLRSVIGATTCELFHTTYLSCLIDRYRSGSIRPSTVFLSRIGENDHTAGITFDCLFDDALRPDSRKPSDTSFLSAPSACILNFWSALTSSDQETARQAVLTAGKVGSGPHGATIQALMRTELAYAEGNLEGTALGARSALLAHSSDSPPKLEARAHRMMGLTALASERYADAADYLSNAHELAELAGDHYERMMSAYARAITEFMTGSLVKADLAAGQAAVSARNIFRMDGLAAVESLKGRIDLELGDYGKAAERYQKLEVLGNTFELAGVAPRSRIWQGRALAYAGDHQAAASLLEKELDDTEARIFMGELEILRGRPRDARTWLDKPIRELFCEEVSAPDSQRPFRPSDRFEWSSPFAEIEGRCIDFSRTTTPLADLELALTLFAVGLDEDDPACAEGLHNLTRSRRAAKANPGMGNYCFFCYLLAERLQDPPVDKLTVLSRAFKVLQQRAGRIESRIQREKYMEKNAWNRRLLEAARIHKFI
jgi:tetratricopeptide (TPR) repeat protein